MKVIVTFKGLRMKGDPILKVVGLAKIDLIMFQLFRFCLILIPKPGGAIIRAKWRVQRVRFHVRDRWLSFRYWIRFRDQLSFRQAMREWAYDRDYSEPREERVARHTIDGYSREDGSIFVREWTDDNLDEGSPNESAEWEWRARDREAFVKRAGKTRTGCSGVKVFVTLDGKRI